MDEKKQDKPNQDGTPDNEKLKYQLDHCKLLWDKIKLNQETSDRYFYYFLLFITTPIVLLAAIITKMEQNNTPNHNLLAAISFTLTIIGFWFYHGTNRYRLARLNLFTQLKRVELEYIEPYLYDTPLQNSTGQEKGIVVNFFSQFGADFSVNAVQMVTNSFWGTTSFYFFENHNKVSLALIFISMFFFKFLYAENCYLKVKKGFMHFQKQPKPKFDKRYSYR